MRSYSLSPAAVRQRARRERLWEARLAAGWVDGRYGRRPDSGTNAERVKAWRHRHPDVARLWYRMYNGLKRSPLFQRAWPEIVAHYGGVCVACHCADRVVMVDHVEPLGVDESRNRLDNLQPLCRRCNTLKREQSTDYRPDRGMWIRARFGAASMEPLHSQRRHYVSIVP